MDCGTLKDCLASRILAFRNGVEEPDIFFCFSYRFVFEKLVNVQMALGGICAIRAFIGNKGFVRSFTAIERQNS